ncbi:hypothetical protein D9613_000506 [Agrocybe pediades]|uniref:Uncharacterized protein n=1 Tax=Agrocybe pediades TaxID=84607 RepID=A0A8H4R151_9AGAR|nr:hypothetical protein D9613_000506 [Agrocybe pediades]
MDDGRILVSPELRMVPSKGNPSGEVQTPAHSTPAHQGDHTPLGDFLCLGIDLGSLSTSLVGQLRGLNSSSPSVFSILSRVLMAQIVLLRRRVRILETQYNHVWDVNRKLGHDYTDLMEECNAVRKDYHNQKLLRSKDLREFERQVLVLESDKRLLKLQSDALKVEIAREQTEKLAVSDALFESLIESFTGARRAVDPDDDFEVVLTHFIMEAYHDTNSPWFRIVNAVVGKNHEGSPLHRPDLVPSTIPCQRSRSTSDSTSCQSASTIPSSKVRTPKEDKNQVVKTPNRPSLPTNGSVAKVQCRATLPPEALVAPKPLPGLRKSLSTRTNEEPSVSKIPAGVFSAQNTSLTNPSHAINANPTPVRSPLRTIQKSTEVQAASLQCSALTASTSATREVAVISAPGWLEDDVDGNSDAASDSSISDCPHLRQIRKTIWEESIKDEKKALASLQYSHQERHTRRRTGPAAKRLQFGTAGGSAPRLPHAGLLALRPNRSSPLRKNRPESYTSPRAAPHPAALLSSTAFHNPPTYQPSLKPTLLPPPSIKPLNSCTQQKPHTLTPESKTPVTSRIMQQFSFIPTTIRSKPQSAPLSHPVQVIMKADRPATILKFKKPICRSRTANTNSPTVASQSVPNDMVNGHGQPPQPTVSRVAVKQLAGPSEGSIAHISPSKPCFATSSVSSILEP